MMSDLNCLSSVRYYCTAGNGMEYFLVQELKTRMAAEDVCQIPGKVFFSTSAGISKVRQLKSAERLFLLLKKDSPITLPGLSSPAKAALMLQSRLLGDRSEWMGAVMTWSRLQRELAHSGTVGARSTALEAKKRTSRLEDERGRENEGGLEGVDGELWNSVCQEEKDKELMQDEEKEMEGCVRNRQNESQTSGTCQAEAKGNLAKRNREAGGQMERSGEVNTTQAPERKRKRDACEDEGGEGRNSSDSSPGHVSFRISCRSTGALSRRLNTQELSRVIGSGLCKMLGWKVDLKNPQLEIHVYMSDDHCVMGIPLTRVPLANRSYIQTTGLRSTVAWAMGSLADIQPGSCVLDPMCGVATILLEAAQEHKNVHFLGVDIDDGQLQKASENVAFADLRDRIHLLKASCTELPLPRASVDAVVCDLPFGRKFDTKTHMASSLPIIITEMERVLRVGGTMVLLLSPQLSCLLKKLHTDPGRGPTPSQDAEHQTGLGDCQPRPDSCMKQETNHTQPGVRQPFSQGAEPRDGVEHGSCIALSSMKHEMTHRVSLGAIDGLISKYIKIHS